MTQTETLSVSLDDRSYDILIGSGLLAEAGDQITRHLGPRRARVVCDEAVAQDHLPVLETSLRDAGIDTSAAVVVPSGESSKSFGRFQSVCESLLASRIERSTVLIALGGGVIGDLTGFAAATLLRGLDFVQVPTTLLSQVDSSVGGKTGINATAGKNLVGAFHQPRLVMIDTATLHTLPRRELLCGYAELVKHSLIVDADFFTYLEANAARMLDGDEKGRIDAIRRSCAIKAAIVARDEHETGDRALLNFGHTFGHALEALTGYGDVLKHGEGVAIGTIMALDLSVRLGLCPPADRDRVIHHYRQIGLPVHVQRHWGIETESMMAAMSSDKKSQAGRIAFILSRGIGRAFVTRDVPPDEVRACIQAAITDAPENM